MAHVRERSALERALIDLSRALSSLGVPWMVIGGVAVITTASSA